MPDSNYLTEEISHGDLSALLAKLYDELPSLIWYACGEFHHYPKPDEIEDLRAEIIVRFFKNDGHTLKTFHSDKGKLNTWLHAVVRNYVSGRLKRQRKWDSLEDVLPETLMEQPRQELNVSTHEELAAVIRVVTQLSARQQAIFRLICAELSTSEMAERLKIKPESVRRVKYELRQKIKAGLEKNGRGGANSVPEIPGRKLKKSEKSESTFLLEMTIWLMKRNSEIQNKSVFWKRS